MQEKKLRAESFLGIHFDFHVRPDTHPVGAHQRPDIFAEMLDAVKPDFMQCDTKGHMGYSSYPTKVGTPAPDIQCDNLRMLRELTRERGIALYGHHSGVYDIYVATNHPDWAVIREDGTVSKDHLSVFGPYSDEYLIPQLKELAVDYELDGAWIDGECWGTEVDYSEYARAAWKRKTGREDCPRSTDGDFEEYREFCRQGFRDYVQHYIDEVKRVRPKFQITSNWMFSGMMPEKPSVTVDFLSGDYSAQNAYNSARFHARCLMHQDRAWDLMAWGHNAPERWQTDNRSTKELTQYCQEASVVLALGGAFQFFNHQYDGGCLVQQWAIPIWKKVAEFCRERQEYCHQAESIPQCAILYSAMVTRKENDQLFGARGENVKKIQALVELLGNTQLPSDIVLSYQATFENLKRYGLVLIPDVAELEPEVLSAVEDYLNDGGSVLFCGPHAARLQGLDIEDHGNDHLIYLSYNGSMAAYQGIAGSFVCPEGWDIVEYCYSGNYYQADREPMLLIRSVGKGKAAVLNFDLGDLYETNKTTLIRSLMISIAERLFPDRMVRVTGSMYADITLMKKNGRVFLNVVNCSGPHADATVRSFSELLPLRGLDVELRTDTRPTGIMLQPGSLPVSFSWENGIARFRIDEVPIHKVAEICFVQQVTQKT